MNDAEWRRLRLLYRFDRAVTLLSWAVASASVVMAMYWALTGRTGAAVIAAIFALVTASVARWDPPWIKIENPEDMR